MFPAKPLIVVSAGYGDATPLPWILIALDDVPIRMFQPPAISPTLFPESSRTKSFHAPLATVPFSEDRNRPIGAPDGAGAGKASPGSKSAGRNVPDVSGPLSGNRLLVESSIDTFRLLTGVDPPTSDINTTPRPLGLTRSTSTSSGEE